jgi:hypothetical protein
MWTGRKLNNDYTTLYEIEVCCDTENCMISDREYPIDYVDEWNVKAGNLEYSRFDMTAVKAVTVTTKDRIHVKTVYLSKEQREECLADICAWIKKYGSPRVIENARASRAFTVD